MESMYERQDYDHLYDMRIDETKWLLILETLSALAKYRPIYVPGYPLVCAFCGEMDTPFVESPFPHADNCAVSLAQRLQRVRGLR